jgi:hypothetical protein
MESTEFKAAISEHIRRSNFARIKRNQFNVFSEIGRNLTTAPPARGADFI